MMVICDKLDCNNIATYELEWQDYDGFSIINVCDEHFPDDPDIVQCFCNIRKLDKK
jgi:hypothetical protein